VWWRGQTAGISDPQPKSRATNRMFESLLRLDNGEIRVKFYSEQCGGGDKHGETQTRRSPKEATPQIGCSNPCSALIIRKSGSNVFNNDFF